MAVHDADDVTLDCSVDLVRADGLLDQQLLERVQCLLPLPWERDTARVLRVLNSLEFLNILRELLCEAFVAL